MSARLVTCAAAAAAVLAGVACALPAGAATTPAPGRTASSPVAAQVPAPFTIPAGLRLPETAPAGVLPDLSGSGVVLHHDFRDKRAATVDDGESLPGWDVVFDGAARRAGVRVIPDRGLRLAPDVADSPDETHAALVVSQLTFETDTLELSVAWTTRRQLRDGSRANPWEMGWLVWDYRDVDHFTYLILKPNGWEIGRRDPAGVGGQRFLATGTTAGEVPGQRRSVTVHRTGTLTRVVLGERELATVHVGPDETGGAVGFYCEDSIVDWHWVRARATA